MPGPLQGLKVIEFQASGPVPYAGMMLSDMGADVVSIEQPTRRSDIPGAQRDRQLLKRNRRSIVLDLKSNSGLEIVRRLIARSDILIEGWRPGVAERLGIGPEDCFKLNPGLVFGRATGWGQTGPLADRAGHDINYLALSGTLHAIGRADGPPVAPMNLLGDFGGGGMMLAYGVMCAVFEAQKSGLGQVVDTAMLDGITSLSTSQFDAFQRGSVSEERGTNLLDSGCPFYDVYECADGKHVAIGALEEKFFKEFWVTAQLEEPMPARQDTSTWPALRKTLEDLFRQRTRDEWAAIFSHTDSCVSPVLSWSEVSGHPHNQDRQTLAQHDDIQQPSPAPRFSRTPGAVKSRAPEAGEHKVEILTEIGYSEAEIAALRI
jgi:alpha-methylacyl-CoA racemase